MASIVVELQRDSLNPTTAASDLLRKALLIAAKLDLHDFNTWIENELGGYEDQRALPAYRILTGQVMAQDRWGRWIPVLFPSSSTLETVATVRLCEAAAQIEAFLQGVTQGEGGNLTLDFSPEEE